MKLEEIIVPTRELAERVASELAIILNGYDVVYLSDLKELVGLPTTYKDSRWGWTSLNCIVLCQVSQGYRIDLPEVKELVTIESRSKS